MTPLATAIQSLGLSGTAAEIRTALDADVELPHDHTLWTYNGVATTFGPEAAEGLAQAMNAAGLTTAVMVYASRGFDLSLDLTRQQLDAIAAGVPQLAQVCAALKAIGRPTIKRYAYAGLESLPSEAEITAAFAEIAECAEQEARYQSCLAFWNRISRAHDMQALTADEYADAKKELS